MKLTPAVCWEIVDAHIAWVTIERPAQRNAIDHDVIDGLREAWQRLAQNEALRVGVLTGSGEQAFCAGMDLKVAAAQRLAVPPAGFLPVLGDAVHVGKPVIAAVNGVAYAGGFLLAQMCDLCVAAEHARFAITEAKVGRGMPWAAPLAHMLPQRVWMELMLTGAPMTARRGHELGFVNDVVPLEGLRARTLELAHAVMANAPLTIAAAREMVYRVQGLDRAAALAAARELFEPVYLSEDAQEGPRAFAEKRPPRWRGR